MSIQGTYDIGYDEVTEDREILTVAGDDSRIPESLRWEINSALRGDDAPMHPRVTVIDDRGQPTSTPNRIDCAILDVTCSDGAVIRVGYYRDGGTTLMDLAKGCSDCEEWAGEWDEDGLVPVYLEL